MIFLALLAMAIGALLVLSLVLVGLVEAPWPVLLVGLLAALYGLQRELSESQAIPLPEEVVAKQSSPPQENHPAPKQAATEAKSDPSADGENVLTYRGIRYSVAKPKAQDSQHHESKDLVEGVYRGQHWQRWRTDATAQLQDASQESEITYRGHKVIKPHQDSE